MTVQLRSYAETHPGAVRDRNEDAFLDRPDLGLFAVADGAGGHQSGALASGMLAEALAGVPAGLEAGELLADVRARVDGVHAALLAEAERRGPEVAIASTVAILCVRGDRYACLWAGDSRIYRLSERRLVCLTHDHSLVQELVDAGHITPAQAEGHPRANVVTRAVGAGDALVLDKATDELRPGDRFLLCSDGLTKALAEADIAVLLAEGGADVARRLVDAALARQARDNVTALVVEVAF